MSYLASPDLERKKRAMDMKWIFRDQAELVTRVWEPMPYPFNGEKCECDDQDIFITPSSSQTPTRKSTSQNVSQRGNLENGHLKQAL